ncbi:hypothetical protein H1P_5250003 [Hyella patelloides LEGE 07179]|uniref:Uncharacterized protein n=1 Tax=Hyella patelloides LEGE 07179 TaxID=945734 RepID=A0A563W002_9CYAN|nr:hypothetical protein H1P_5250003 [Hyella patelloides LEGE 07179]
MEFIQTIVVPINFLTLLNTGKRMKDALKDTASALGLASRRATEGSPLGHKG